MPDFVISSEGLMLLVHLLNLLLMRSSSLRSMTLMLCIYTFLFCWCIVYLLFITLYHIQLCRVKEFNQFSEKSDVYGFGVFLLELLSGRHATEQASPDSYQNMVEWVCSLVHICSQISKSTWLPEQFTWFFTESLICKWYQGVWSSVYLCICIHAYTILVVAISSFLSNEQAASTLRYSLHCSFKW